MKNTFCKEERLCSKVLIDIFFEQDKTVKKWTEYPFILRVKEIEFESNYPCKVLFSVSKRKIKLAVNRNLIKRRAKEAYRLNKHELYSKIARKNKKLVLAFIYIGNKPLPYSILEEKIIVLLNRLKEEEC